MKYAIEFHVTINSTTPEEANHREEKLLGAVYDALQITGEDIIESTIYTYEELL